MHVGFGVGSSPEEELYDADELLEKELLDEESDELEPPLDDSEPLDADDESALEDEPPEDEPPEELSLDDELSSAEELLPGGVGEPPGLDEELLDESLAAEDEGCEDEGCEDEGCEDDGCEDDGCEDDPSEEAWLEPPLDIGVDELVGVPVLLDVLFGALDSGGGFEPGDPTLDGMDRLLTLAGCQTKRIWREILPPGKTLL